MKFIKHVQLFVEFQMWIALTLQTIYRISAQSVIDSLPALLYQLQAMQSHSQTAISQCASQSDTSGHAPSSFICCGQCSLTAICCSGPESHTL